MGGKPAAEQHAGGEEVSLWKLERFPKIKISLTNIETMTHPVTTFVVFCGSEGAFYIIS